MDDMRVDSDRHDDSYGRWTRHMNVERDRYAGDLLQPVDRYGGVNKNFRKVYGDRTIKKEYKNNLEVLDQLRKEI